MRLENGRGAQHSLSKVRKDTGKAVSLCVVATEGTAWLVLHCPAGLPPAACGYGAQSMVSLDR